MLPVAQMRVAVPCGRALMAGAGVGRPGRLVPLRGGTARRRPALLAPLCAAGKGFSKKARQAKNNPNQAEDGGKKKREKRVKFKGKKTARTGPQRSPAIPQGPPSMTMPDLNQNGPLPADEAVTDVDFEKRLAMVAMEGSQKKQEAQEKRQSVLEGDIYSNPPPLTQTVLGNSASSSETEYESGKFGPGQAALAGISIFAAVAFLSTSFSSDLVMSTQSSAPSRSKAAKQRTEIEEQKIKEMVRTFEAALAENPEDLEALEGLGVSYAQLGDFSKAIPKLKSLAAAKPEDVEVLRLLAEAQASNKDVKSAVATYRQAQEASSAERLELLQGLVSTLVGDKQETKAVDELQAARTRASSGASADFSPIEVDLLLARVFSQWSGHNSDAFKVYNTLIRDYPEDFRGYLAKGVLLRNSGQKGDAERMFIQAKYLAPPEARAVVNRVLAANE